MTYELLGSFIALALAYLAVRIRNRWIIYVVFILALLFGGYKSQYYSRFIIGVALADLFVTFPKIKYQLALVIFTGLVGIFLLTYPRNGLTPGQPSIYNILPLVQSIKPTIFWQTIGGGLVTFTILYSSVLQKILDTRPLQFLSRISYSAFILHLIIIGSFSTWFFHWLKTVQSMSFGTTFTIAYLSTLGLILCFAYVFTRLVDEPGIRLSKWIYIRFFQKG